MTAKEVRPVIFNKPGATEDLKDFGPKPVPSIAASIDSEIEASPKEEEVAQEEIVPVKKIAIAKEKKKETEQTEAG